MPLLLMLEGFDADAAVVESLKGTSARFMARALCADCDADDTSGQNSLVTLGGVGENKAGPQTSLCKPPNPFMNSVTGKR